MVFRGGGGGGSETERNYNAKSHVLKRLGEEGVQVSPLTSRLVKTVPLGVGVGALKVTEGPL